MYYPRFKKLYIYFYFILYLLNLLFNQALCREILDRPNLALQKIKIYTTSPILSKTQEFSSKYQNQRLTKENILKIKNDIRSQLLSNGYYLMKVDSMKVQENSINSIGILHLYISPGPQFILNKVSWELVDSLRIEYDELIQEAASNYIGKPYNDELQKVFYQSIVQIFENSGFPLCLVNTKGFVLDSLNDAQMAFYLDVEIIPGPFVKISGLKLPEDSNVNIEFLERTFGFKNSEIYREKRILRYDRLLQRQDFIKDSHPSTIAVGKDSLFYLQMNFEESPSTTFDGIIGYVPPSVNDPSQDGYFTGLVNVSLRNLFTTGRKLHIYWQKPDRLSEEFQINYREPFLLGLPFHLGGALNRLIRDTTYIEWKYALDAEIPLNENLTGLARFYNRQVFPDSLASAVSRLPQTRAVHTELGLQWDTRDDFYNPRRGLFLSALFDYGSQRNIGPQYLVEEDSLKPKIKVTKLTGNLGIFLPLWRRQVLALRFQIVLIGYQGQEVRIPDMFWFGGATTVRGYRENQFYADRVGWINSEYRILLGPQSRFFIFSDFAYYSRKLPQYKKEYLAGYGLGIRFPGPLGILQVDYGLAKGLVFREGKIHFRLINEF